MTSNVINALHAKKRFVESLTNFSKYGDNENFLSPTKSEDKSPLIPNPLKDSNPPARVSSKKNSQNQTNEIQLTETEYNRILSLLESKQRLSKKEKNPSQDNQSVPVWAKLAYASTNPNNRHRSNSDYY